MENDKSRIKNRALNCVICGLTMAGIFLFVGLVMFIVVVVVVAAVVVDDVNDRQVDGRG